MAARRRTRREEATRKRVVSVADLMRRDPLLSLSGAAKLRRTTPRTVRKYTPSNFSRPAGSRRWKVKASDQIRTRRRVFTAQGWQEVTVKGSRERSLWGKYGNTIGKIKRGDPAGYDELRSFYGKEIGDFELETDEEIVKYAIDRGELEDEVFESP